MKIRDNARLGQLTGTPDCGNPDIWRVHDHFSKRGCEFGSSKRREITVRTKDGRRTVYVSRRSNGQWRVIRRAWHLDKDFASFEAMAEAMHGWGFGF